MSLASRIGKLEAALAAMALGASSSAVVARGPADATDADLEAQWAAQLAVLGLSLDMAQSMGVVLVHRVRFFSPDHRKNRAEESWTRPRLSTAPGQDTPLPPHQEQTP